MKKVLLANAVTASVRRSLLNKKANDIVNRLLADDNDESNDRSKLKVLNDGDGVRLLMSIYQDYVSDDDYVKFPTFMYDVDTLLYKARGNRTLTREEREEMEDAAPKKKGRRRPKRPAGNNGNNGEGNSNNAPSKPSGDTVVTAKDLSPVGSFFAGYLAARA